MITVFNFMLKNEFNIKINVIDTTTIVKKKGARGFMVRLRNHINLWGDIVEVYIRTDGQ